VDTVLYFRSNYLEKMKRKETIKPFIQYGQGVIVEWESIKAKIEMEEEKEKGGASSKSKG
jgi:hypothetical protein